MNQKFLSRGKRKDNGEWIIGYYVKIPYKADKLNKECHNIIDLDGKIRCIIPETLGRCADLTDKNGTLIFEGDIVSVNRPRNGTHEVIWDVYGWNLKNFYACCYDYPGEAFSEGTKYMSVVGNIHDNPELLEEVAQNGG